MIKEKVIGPLIRSRKRDRNKKKNDWKVKRDQKKTTLKTLKVADWVYCDLHCFN